MCCTVGLLLEALYRATNIINLSKPKLKQINFLTHFSNDRAKFSLVYRPNIYCTFSLGKSSISSNLMSLCQTDIRKYILNHTYT